MPEATNSTPARSGGKPVPNRSLRRKQAARLLAIRALYAEHFNPADATLEGKVDALLASHQAASHEGDSETSFAEAPERAMLATLLESADQHASAIGELIRGSMGEKWTADRLGPLLEAILRIAIAELLAKRDKNPSIIISEYVLLTEAYFDDSEVSFVNGILASIAKKIRE